MFYKMHIHTTWLDDITNCETIAEFLIDEFSIERDQVTAFDASE